MWTRQGEHAVCASHSNCALKLRCGPNQRTLLDQPSMSMWTDMQTQSIVEYWSNPMGARSSRELVDNVQAFLGRYGQLVTTQEWVAVLKHNIASE
ncbi:hypothetical protein J6590_083238 [Homalodisca vitripennis]|nr:hypothetical protein J6590_083238 [Homalodisca vitripennis]